MVDSYVARIGDRVFVNYRDPAYVNHMYGEAVVIGHRCGELVVVSDDQGVDRLIPETPEIRQSHFAFIYKLSREEMLTHASKTLRLYARALS